MFNGAPSNKLPLFSANLVLLFFSSTFIVHCSISPVVIYSHFIQLKREFSELHNLEASQFGPGLICSYWRRDAVCEILKLQGDRAVNNIKDVLHLNLN